MKVLRLLAAVVLIGGLASCNDQNEEVSDFEHHPIYYCLEYHNQIEHVHNAVTDANVFYGFTAGQQTGVCGSAAVPGIVQTEMLAGYTDLEFTFNCFGFSAPQDTNNGTQAAFSWYFLTFDAILEDDGPLPCGNGWYRSLVQHRGLLFPAGQEATATLTEYNGLHPSSI